MNSKTWPSAAGGRASERASCFAEQVGRARVGGCATPLPRRASGRASKSTGLFICLSWRISLAPASALSARLALTSKTTTRVETRRGRLPGGPIGCLAATAAFGSACLCAVRASLSRLSIVSSIGRIWAKPPPPPPPSPPANPCRFTAHSQTRARARTHTQAHKYALAQTHTHTRSHTRLRVGSTTQSKGAPSSQFTCGVGPNHFIEITRGRATRRAVSPEIGDSSEKLEQLIREFCLIARLVCSCLAGLPARSFVVFVFVSVSRPRAKPN